MAGGGGGGEGGGKGRESGSSNVNSELPGYVRPYYDRLLAEGEAESNRPYQPYSGQRLAARPGDLYSSDSMTRSLASSGYGGLSQANQFFQNAGDQAGAFGSYAPGTFSNQNVTASNVTPGSISSDQINARQWDQDAANQYMSPYINSVLDQQQQRALLDHQRSQIQRNNLATTTGNFNSSRHGVIDALGNEEYTRQLAEINANGLNQAWSQAQGMFGSDRDAALQAGLANQSANLTAGQSNLNSNLQGQLANQSSGLDAQRLNQAADLQRQQYGEDSRQFGANMGLTGLSQQMAAARGLMDTSQLRENMELGRIDSMMRSGDRQMAYDQTQRDIGYNDFQNQQNWNKNNMNWLSGLMSGVPVSPNTQQTDTQYISPLSRILGLGLGLSGIYKNLGGNMFGGGTVPPT